MGQDPLCPSHLGPPTSVCNTTRDRTSHFLFQRHMLELHPPMTERRGSRGYVQTPHFQLALSGGSWGVGRARLSPWVTGTR